MRSKLFLLCAMAISACAVNTPQASASGVAADVCHGCSTGAMAAKALGAINNGTAYVFNEHSKDVNKYLVYFEMEDRRGRSSATKVADEVPVEPELKSKYGEYVTELSLAGNTEIILPPGFPVGSSAHSLMDPPFSETSIEQHISSLSFWSVFLLKAQAIVNSAATKNIPFLDIAHILTSTKVTVQYPDGSTQEFTLEISIKIDSNGIPVTEFEIQSSNEATAPNGGAVPTAPISFDGFEVSNGGGSIQDWIDWATHNNIPVTGAGGQGCTATGMTCGTNNNGILRCVATYTCG